MAREFGDVLAETLRCAADCASRSQQESKEMALLSPLNHLTKEVIVLASVARDGIVLAYAVAPFESGEHIVLSAVRQNGSALRNADEVLHRNRQVVIEAVNNTAPLSKTPKTVFAQTATWWTDLEIVLAAAKQSSIVRSTPPWSLRQQNNRLPQGQEGVDVGYTFIACDGCLTSWAVTLAYNWLRTEAVRRAARVA